jgi:hypothetical protein
VTAEPRTASSVKVRSGLTGGLIMRLSFGSQGTGPSPGPVFRNDP